ncbi:MAG: hypothetical protein AB7V42_03710 [Thermoleophilia bacterium]
MTGPSHAGPVEAYSAHAANWPVLTLVTAAAVPLVALPLVSGRAPSAAGVAMALAIAGVAVIANLVTASSLRVTAGPRGVLVRFGALGWPRFRFPVEEIAGAEATEIPRWSSAWGIGWTRRDGLRLTLRTGPALRLTLVSGRRVTVNVDDPDRARRVLDAARRAAGCRPSSGSP